MNSKKNYEYFPEISTPQLKFPSDSFPFKYYTPSYEKRPEFQGVAVIMRERFGPHFHFLSNLKKCHPPSVNKINIAFFKRPHRVDIRFLLVLHIFYACIIMIHKYTYKIQLKVANQCFVSYGFLKIILKNSFFKSAILNPK